MSALLFIALDLVGRRWAIIESCATRQSYFLGEQRPFRAPFCGTAGALKVVMQTVIEIPGDEFERELREKTVPMLVHFCSSWCAQCEMLAPSLAALADQFKDEIHMTKVDLDRCPELAKRYGIVQVPTLILFEGGLPIACIDVSMSPRQMTAQLQGLLADYAPYPRMAVAR
jgi:thioredoxin 1